jgi:hypothetical protein
MIYKHDKCIFTKKPQGLICRRGRGMEESGAGHIYMLETDQPLPSAFRATELTGLCNRKALELAFWRF